MTTEATQTTQPEGTQPAPTENQAAVPAVVPSIGEPEATPATPPSPPPESAGDEFVYDSTGDAGLDYALAFVGKQGFGPEHPAIKAAQGGDFSLIRAELATKGVQGSDAVLALAESAFKAHQAKAADNAKALQATAEQAAGGAENWNVVRAWASANAEPAEKAAVNAALAQGGFVAEAVVKQLVALYQQGNTLAKEAANPAPNAGTQPQAANGPLTAQAYAEAVNALYTKLGGRLEGSHEYADLQARRVAARNAGY